MPSLMGQFNPLALALTALLSAASHAAPSTLGAANCVHAATLTLECAGGVGLGGQASNARLRFHAGIQDATACGLALCPTDTILVDTVINVAPWAGSTDCAAITDGLLGDIAAGIDQQSGGTMSWAIVTGAGQTPSILIQSEVPFHCCFCGSEIGAACMANRGYPLGVCALYNIADGTPGNQTDDPGEFVSGLGLACFDGPCPGGASQTLTPTNTLPPSTPTPTPSFTPSTTATPSTTPTPTPSPAGDLAIVEVGLQPNQQYAPETIVNNPTAGQVLFMSVYLNYQGTTLSNLTIQIFLDGELQCEFNFSDFAEGDWVIYCNSTWTVEPGMHTLEARIDPDNTILESDETNNIGSIVYIIPGGEATPTATPTNQTSLPCDSGYYILDSLGGRHRVGNPIHIVGPVYFGMDMARDLERAVCDVEGATHEDLVVLGGFGLAHFVQGQACNISQDFFFGDMETRDRFPQGRAVDFQMTADSAGFWVLSDFGEIYRAGSALVGASSPEVGVGRERVLGFDIPTLRNAGTRSLIPVGTSLRAVSFLAIDEDRNSQAEGYILLDSMGGRFHYLPDGSPVPAGTSAGLAGNEPLRLLDPTGYDWPFFPGLDIARDLEPHPSQGGVVILDGWDGIHPVPVDNRENPVWFARNEDPESGGPAQMVGMPYIVLGFDDPTTGPGIDEDDPFEYGLDAASIFTDLEFSAGCPDSGLYTLDKFGGVFALGSARASETEPVPGFGNSPYFYPFLYAEALEVFAGDETGFGREETGFVREMVTLPPGSFLMGNSGDERDQDCLCSGCDCEEPRHTVTIGYSFQLGKYEVTNAQYAEVLNSANEQGYLRNSSNGTYNGGDVFYNGQFLVAVGEDYSDLLYSGGQFVSKTRSNESMANHPVKVVSWYGSVAFCNWLSRMEGRSPAYNLSNWSLINRQGGGYRLPSESEWEYACRGSASNPSRYAPFSFGDDTPLNLDTCRYSAILNRYMVWCGNDDGWTEAVGSKLPNDYGLYDMHGNIWEWCQDCWHGSYSGSNRPDDGQPWMLSQSEYCSTCWVIRGGYWEYHASICRSANRSIYCPQEGVNFRIGFRFARTPQ